MVRPTDAELAEWDRGIDLERARIREMLSALRSERDRADAAEGRLVATRELHRPISIDAVVESDCINEQCAHEEECPTTKVDVCKHCYDQAEAVAPYFAETDIGSVLTPCATVHSLNGEVQP